MSDLDPNTNAGSSLAERLIVAAPLVIIGLALAAAFAWWRGWL